MIANTVATVAKVGRRGGNLKFCKRCQRPGDGTIIFSGTILLVVASTASIFPPSDEGGWLRSGATKPGGSDAEGFCFSEPSGSS